MHENALEHLIDKWKLLPHQLPPKFTPLDDDPPKCFEECWEKQLLSHFDNSKTPVAKLSKLSFNYHMLKWRACLLSHLSWVEGQNYWKGKLVGWMCISITNQSCHKCHVWKIDCICQECLISNNFKMFWSHYGFAGNCDKPPKISSIYMYIIGVGPQFCTTKFNS